ncbi:MAG: ATP-binding cassette domain-containing protein [Acidimicrobiales bacterium]
MASDGEGLAIEVDGLVKRFGDVEAIAGLSFEVRRGEILGLLGPNGAGKTTTVNVLSTLIEPDAGAVRVDGFDVVAESHRVRQAISLTGQFAAVDAQLSGHENLVLFARLRGLPKGEAAARSTELLADFGLTDAADRRVGEYSGGMRRRLDIACSLVVEPRVLFLDEPTTGLDPRSRSELWQVVRRLRAGGITIVLTTQYLEEADLLADRIVVIDEGRSVAAGTAAELKQATGGTTCVVSIVEAGRLDEAEQLAAPFGEVAVDPEQGELRVASESAIDTLPEVIGALRGAGITIAEAGIRQPTLDEVFLALTDRSGAAA